MRKAFQGEGPGCRGPVVGELQLFEDGKKVLRLEEVEGERHIEQEALDSRAQRIGPGGVIRFRYYLVSLMDGS